MPANPLLASKLYLPPPRPNTLQRPRLLADLSKGLEGSLTLISAPAGFGKTTLASDWLRLVGRPVAWLSLDEGDNDPSRFFAYLSAALQQIEPSVGKNLPGLLQSVPPAPLQALVSALIGDLTAIPQPFVLSLDDFHAITLPQIHQAVAFLLEHRLPGMHLVLISRTDPDFPLSRLRARGELTELRAEDLCFTREEASQFLNEISGLNLTPAQIAELETRTEGWITGLQLLTLSIQGRPDVAAFIADFTGSHRYITDYLMEEVLRGQPQAVQDFLLQTSLLDRLNSELCDFVLGDKGTRDRGSQEILEYLDRANLFVVPLDEKRQWYRYHYLFADVLRNRLRQIYPQRIQAIHIQAATWYGENGYIEQAVQHVLAAGDLERAAQIVEDSARGLLQHGEIATLIHWSGEIPTQALHNHPWLCVHYGTALMLAGQIPAVEPLFQSAEQVIGKIAPSHEQHLNGYIAAMRANISARSGNVLRTIELARRALDLLPGEDLTLRSVVTFVLGNAHLLNKEIVPAGQAFSEAAQMGKQGGNYFLAVAAISNQARLNVMQGDLNQACSLFATAQRLAEEQSETSSRLMDFGFAWMADVLRERNELSTARHSLEVHIQRCERTHSTDALMVSQVILARTFYALGNLADARQMLRKAQAMVQDYRIDLANTSQLSACQVLMAIASGDLAQAGQVLQAWESDSGVLPPYLNDLRRLARVRLLIAENNHREALEQLHSLEAAVRSARLDGILLEILVLKSLAMRNYGRQQDALQVLLEALHLAASQGFVRLFADEGRPMAELLLKVRKMKVEGSPTVEGSKLNVEGASKAYANRLLKALLSPLAEEPSERRDHLQLSSFQPETLVEPLTAREREVLRLIAGGSSNQEIAEKLVIEITTAKRHLSNIYAKLGVQSRTQAIVRARELNLL